MRTQILVLLVTVGAGCGSSMLKSGGGGGQTGGPSGTGGAGAGQAGGPAAIGSASGGQAGAPSATGGAGAGGAAFDGGMQVSPDECGERPAPRGGATAPITVQVQLTYAGDRVTFGVPFAVEGGSLTVTNLRFYLSKVALRLRTGGDVPVDLIGADGAPVPYGVVLVNAEEPSAMTFQIAVPAGDYSALSFLVGIPDVCNGAYIGRSAPLSAASQMTWPLPFGYLFLRYAGTRGDGTPVDAPPGAIDMGGFPGHIFAPRVEVATDLRTEAAGPLQLTVAMDQLFRAATLPADLDDYARALSSIPTLGFAQLNGQHVIQNLNAVSAFTLSAGP